MLEQASKVLGLIGGVVGIAGGLAASSFFLGGEWTRFNENARFIDNFRHGGDLSISKVGWESFTRSLVENGSGKFLSNDDLSLLQGRLDNLGKNLQEDRAAIRYTITKNGVNEECPDGFKFLGVISIRMRGTDYRYNNVGASDDFEGGWRYTNPALCERK